MRKRLTLRTLTLTDIDGQFSGLDGIELGPVLACKSDTFDLCSRLCCPWPWPTWESCTDLEQRERPRMKPRTLAPITTLPLWALETTSSKLGRRTMYKASCQLIKQSFITREAFFFSPQTFLNISNNHHRLHETFMVKGLLSAWRTSSAARKQNYVDYPVKEFHARI